MELVAKKMSIYTLEVGITKLMGISLGDINAICKEGNLMCYKLRQRLIEHYSNVPYMSDAMLAYSHLSQGDNELTTQYLVRAKILLESIHHTSKLSDNTGSSWDKLYLVCRLKAPHIRKRVTKEQDSWRMMEYVFQTINHITQTEGKTKVYHEPNFESVPHVSKERVHKVSFSKYTKPNSPVKAYNNSLHNTQYSSNFRNGNEQHSSQFHRGQGKQQYNCRQGKLECYYCKGDHIIRDYEKFSKDRTKNNLKTTDLVKKYMDKLRQAIRKGNITVNEATFSNAQELTYSMEQAEQLLVNLHFSNSESKCLDWYMTLVTIDEVSSENVILYKVRVK